MKLRIRYKLLSPLSHIGETASTGSYFQTILTSAGRVPVITGNSIRGKLRDSIALHMLDLLGCKVDKEVFHVLFSGGNISGTMKDDVGRSKQVREHFPAVSLLGGGLGTMIMQGKLVSAFAYPVCVETEQFTGVDADGKSWHNLIEEIEFTRTDDSKNDVKAAYIADMDAEKTGKASTQMRFAVQYVAAGAEFVQDFIFADNVTPLELGAFYAGLQKWFEAPVLGGMSAKGFGLFEARSDGGEIAVDKSGVRLNTQAQGLVDAYNLFLVNEGNAHFGLLKEAKSSGKKSNGAAEDNSASD